MVELREHKATLASRHIIERPRLTRLLDETTARVIMLVAPAGYGKTTLARQWLANRPHVWFEAGSASTGGFAVRIEIPFRTDLAVKDAARRESAREALV